MNNIKIQRGHSENSTLFSGSVQRKNKPPYNGNYEKISFHRLFWRFAAIQTVLGTARVRQNVAGDSN